jgi:hypothetical protein
LAVELLAVVVVVVVVVGGRVVAGQNCSAGYVRIDVDLFFLGD